MENRKISGIILIILGIVLIPVGLFFLVYLIFFSIACIIVGIYLSSFGVSTESEWKDNPELVKKKIIISFNIGTIIIGFTCFAVWGDLGLKSLGGWSGIYAIALATPAYLMGIIIVIYAISLIGGKWIWAYFPLAIILSGISLIQMISSNELGYRVGWFLLFPLNYLILLVLINVLIIAKREIYGTKILINLLTIPLSISIGAIAGYFIGGIVLAIILSGLGAIEGYLFNSSKERSKKMLIIGFVYVFVMVFFFYILPILFRPVIIPVP